MLKNNVLYRSLLVVLCAIFLVLEMLKLYNMDILLRLKYISVLVLLSLATVVFNKSTVVIKKIMKMIITRTVKYTLDLLTLIFLFVYFSIKIFNVYYKYDLKNIQKYILEYHSMPQFSLSVFFISLAFITVVLWMSDISNIINKVFLEIEVNPSVVGFESFSFRLRIFCLICYMVSLVGLVYILYDLFLEGLMGTFGLV